MTAVREMIVDSFAGGGGASTGIEMALGMSPDYAVNHDGVALGMHAVNHPRTKHLASNIWKVDPDAIEPGRPIGLLWASPDCTDHSKAKGGMPLRKHIRDLAWVVVLWAQRRRPRVIILENVEEFRDWGPLIERADGTRGRCPERKGTTFERWVRELRKLGYAVQWRELRACDYGAPTIRKRLFVIARCDGEPIVWPKPTHAKGGVGGLEPWRVAAEVIDWSLPCHSIFLNRDEARAVGVKRPLADATMARIAKGVKRYVLDAPQPYIVSYYGAGQGGTNRTHDLGEPCHTVTAGGAHLNVVSAFLAQHNTDMTGHDAREPVSTIVGKGCTQAVVSAGLVNMKGSDRRQAPPDAPSPTQTASGWHIAEVRAFLLKYYGEGRIRKPAIPWHTATAKARFGLVTVHGEPYQIVDIGMRMLTPRELFRAQGFPDSYVIDWMPDGSAITKTNQIRMCGNSVCPQVAAALVRANYAVRTLEAPDEAAEFRLEAAE